MNGFLIVLKDMIIWYSNISKNYSNFSNGNENWTNGSNLYNSEGINFEFTNNQVDSLVVLMLL